MILITVRLKNLLFQLSFVFIINSFKSQNIANYINNGGRLRSIRQKINSLHFQYLYQKNVCIH